ncbi:MAG: cyclic nucleotide-binding domain-containing protein [Verrucomicrobiae bacterium]|nr:cyclic nucleotide-binding domain-containing protein [Verrucomicrobiae bacterium]
MIFEAGHFLIRQGDVESHAFVIESGSVKIVLDEAGEQHVLGIISAGEVVGEMALFEDAPRSAHVVAVEKTSARKLTRQELADMMNSDPQASMPFIHAIFERLRTSNVMFMAAQQTRQLIRRTRVKLILSPASEAAASLCPKPVMVELDVIPQQESAMVAVNGLAPHFDARAEALLPDMRH